VIIDVTASGVAPEALVEASSRRDFMIRQGGYHTERFAHRFVKVSTTVPAQWVREFCDRLPELVETARGINAVDAKY
jgi:hypothetical protein